MLLKCSLIHIDMILPRHLIFFIFASMLMSRSILITLSFFYKQPVYKQLALGWQIAKQRSGQSPLSRRNN